MSARRQRRTSRRPPARSPATASTSGSGCPPRRSPASPRALPLCALIAGWVRGAGRTRLPSVQVRAYRRRSGRRRAPSGPGRGCAPNSTPHATTGRRAGRRRRREHPDPVGARRLRPGRRSPVQDALDDALAAGDAAALTGLPDGDRRPGRLPGAGRADRTRRRGRPRELLPRRALRCRLLRRRLDPVTAVRPIAIVGPTGTGKSELALAVADALSAESASRSSTPTRCSSTAAWTSAPPSCPPAERRGIPHHQLDVLEVTETATVARYQQAAAADVEAIAARGAVPVIVGGSMLYVQSLLDDWSFPATDPQVRARWEQRLAEVGVAALHARAGRGRRRQRRRRSCPPTDGASCGRWRSWS